MIRWIGAGLLVAGCGGFGFSLASSQRREIRMLQGLIRALQEMAWELKYRCTALPELCVLAGEAGGGQVKKIFLELADQLERQEITEISGCLNGLIQQQVLPGAVRRNLRQLGMTLGRYDLEGQLQGLESVQQQCRKDLELLEEGSRQRLRCYQTLSLCAGAALAILLV